MPPEHICPDLSCLFSEKRCGVRAAALLFSDDVVRDNVEGKRCSGWYGDGRNLTDGSGDAESLGADHMHATRCTGRPEALFCTLLCPCSSVPWFTAPFPGLDVGLRGPRPFA